MTSKDLGLVTAYAYAVSQGYTGTEEEFAELMASYATVAEEAAESATEAAASATAAGASETNAAASAASAGQSATSAGNSATSASGSAVQAQASATAAGQSATQAAGSATAAGNSATAAAGSATQAAASETAAGASATAAAGSATSAGDSATAAAGSATEADASADRAQEILDSIPEDYSELSDDVADLKSAIGDVASAQESAFKSISENNSIYVHEIDDVSQLTAGSAINGQGVIITESQSYCTVKPIAVYDGASFSWNLVVGGDHYGFIYIAFYDASDNFISRFGGSVRGGYELFTLDGESVPNNAKYFRWSLAYVGIGNVSTCIFLEYYPLDVLNSSPRNKWYVLGDSISAGYYSMLTADVPSGETPAISYEDGTCSLWDSSLAHNYWGYANTWRLKRELIGKAYPGQGYFRTAANSQNGVYVVTHNDFSDAGLITVAWGFNDWHYNQPRGNHDLIDASIPYPGENYDTTQITTVNQAIWFCLGELIRQAPNAKIVVQTPMNGWRYGGDWDSNWGIGYAMSNSGKLSDIRDDIVYWANYYGLQILDMTYNNSVVNRRNIKDTIIDGSHPSDAAHQQLGRTVAVALEYC